MISMTYDLGCETFRFISLGERFVSFWLFLGFVEARNEMGQSPPAVRASQALRSRPGQGKASRLTERCAASLGSQADAERGAGKRPMPPVASCASWSVPFDKLRAGFRGRSAAPPNEVFVTRLWKRKKLRKRAANRLKLFVHANLCARRPARLASYSRPRLSPGPASASARPTSSPRSSIEVCSRTVRSSPFACRSACSGERATLTVTFDSTSGWR
jgi:hypothetical protein